MSVISIAGIDPALANFGMVRGLYNIDKKVFTPSSLLLKTTEKMSSKSVRVSSDDLRRAQELREGFKSFINGCNIVFAEVPYGGQSARAVLGFGISIGILASSHVDVIEVSPSEAKMAAVGTKTASKEEMIDWAYEKYPDLNWLRQRDKPDGKLKNSNEHPADACAIVEAGLKTPTFQQVEKILSTVR